MSVLLVVLAALVGSLVGYLTVRRRCEGKKAVTSALVVAAMVAAIGTNLNQQLLDLGLDVRTVDVIEGASYVVFGFAATAAWMLLEASRARWLLVVLVPL